MTEERETFFDVFGPFEPECEGRKVKSSQTGFWSEVNERCEGLSSGIGCYMFCLDTGRTIRPWYVGMTASQRGFASEIFEPHKRLAYNDALGDHAGGGGIFLFPLLTPGAELSSAGKTARPTIEWLEHYLMMAAFARNPKIKNIRGMTQLRRVEVSGLLGTRKGRPHREVQAVRSALFGDPRRPSDER